MSAFLSLLAHRDRSHFGGRTSLSGHNGHGWSGGRPDPDANDLGFVKPQKIEKRREYFSQIERNRVHLKTFAHLNALSRSGYSIGFARRCVFTQEFIALLGGAAICAPLAARVFVFASGLAASAWHAHVASEAGGQGTTPVVLPQFSCCQSSPFNSLLVGTPSAAVVWAVWGSLPTAAAPRLW